MKKILSLVLSFVMLLSITAGIEISAYAAGWVDYAKSINFDETYLDSCDYTDYHKNDEYYDVYKFTVPVSGIVTFGVECENINNCWNDYYIYSVNNIDKEICCLYDIPQDYSSGRDVYYGNKNVKLSAGTYYFVVKYTWGPSNDYGSHNVTLSYKPSLGKPSNFKVSSRKTTSLKLSWKKVSGASGYQIQQKKSGKWKTIKNTTSNAYTVSKLKAGTSYQFRVRSYKTISGKKYYGSWVTLTTPTKPATVTLSSVSSKKSKQFTAKWKKVTGSGYQIQYSTSKNFSKNKKTVTVSKNSTTSKTISKLKSKKKYYVRVRAYKTVNGTKYCGAWSKTKAVTTKR